jgi:aryl-alcohol dehydrogenase-like predicted oxidoreductase
MHKKVKKLGLGLIGIGRSWGYGQSIIPSEAESIYFLNKALNMGIDFYDTAPAYGLSEERLGRYLKTVSSVARDRIIVSTKFGEHWDYEKQSSYVDHSYKALCNSIDQSIDRLGRIDILQVHKANLQVLLSKDLIKAIEYAVTKNVNKFGVSVSDNDTALYACRQSIFSSIQLPYNVDNYNMEKVIDIASSCNKYLIINRPFNMGKLFSDYGNHGDIFSLMIKYYKFVLAKEFDGVILTGTKSSVHLNENIDAFRLASI